MIFSIFKANVGVMKEAFLAILVFQSVFCLSQNKLGKYEKFVNRDGGVFVSTGFSFGSFGSRLFFSPTIGISYINLKEDFMNTLYLSVDSRINILKPGLGFTTSLGYTNFINSNTLFNSLGVRMFFDYERNFKEKSNLLSIGLLSGIDIFGFIQFMIGPKISINPNVIGSKSGIQFSFKYPIAGIGIKK